jgi:hypothetical protein
LLICGQLSAQFNLECGGNDDMMIDMQFFLARMEYKQITKRLVRGKRLEQKMDIGQMEYHLFLMSIKSGVISLMSVV